MNENGIRIGYEHLFNMGNFEHEKYTISKDVEAGTEFEAYKKLALQIAEFEADLNRYRDLCNKRPNILFDTQHGNVEKQEKARKNLIKLDRMIIAFKEKHKPVFKECKCYYCTHPNARFSYEDDEEYDENEDE